MAADFSRVRLNPLLDYASVELKQGGVLLDADANELAAIIDRRVRALASDTLGRATVSATTPEAFRITLAAGSLGIGRGRLYVDGLLAENHGAVSSDPAKRAFDSLLSEPVFVDVIGYGAQPYLPSAPALPTSGRHLVYLDVWDREVTHLEAPALVESAVAVETSSRVQTVWQVRVLADEAGTATTCGTPDADVPGWAALTAPSTGVLTTGTFDVPPTEDPCELPPTGGYRGLENQLYRVEIHDAGQPGGTATFKWSRDNASVGSRVASVVSATELELTTLGRDEVLRFNTGDWVEIIDDIRELAQACGELRRITVNEATRRIGFTPALPSGMLPGSFPDSAFPNARNLRVRRWDQKGLVFRADPSGTPVQVQDLDAVASTGAIQVPAAGTTLLLENGVTVSFASTGAKGFKAGDTWVFAARTADASVELLDRAPPRGIHHHFARLGIWDVAAGTVTDCRNPWPPQGSGDDCCCTQCVTPESHASGQLTIQGAVDRVRDTGGTVCLAVGRYVLDAPVRIAGTRSIRLTGQGSATVLAAPGSAFIIERSAAIAIDEMLVFSLGQAAAISVRTALGLSLRKLVLLVFTRSDSQGAAIALSGAILGACIEDNLVVATDGIRALEPPAAEAPNALLTAVLRVARNVFVCRDNAVILDGPVGHAYETSITGNQVLGTREVGFSAAGMAVLAASMRISGNNLSVHGPGIRCAVDGSWISDNKLHATRDGDRVLRGAGIALSSGLDKNGSDQAHVLANQLDGFEGAAISIEAPVRELIVKLNIIEACGNGIVMADSASARSLSIENNHLRDIGQNAVPTGAATETTLGIGITRTEAATVGGNTVRKVGQTLTQGKQLIAGIAAFSLVRVRIWGNEVAEIGPLEDLGGVASGILVRGPYEQAEVGHNHVERDAEFSDAPSQAAWFALSIDEPRLGGNESLSRLARFTALRVDERRTLVLAGTSAFVSVIGASGLVDPDTGAEVAPRGASASVLGNVLIARGRVPAVEIEASGDLLFNDNQCELRANFSTTAVLLDAPVVVISANRVRGAEDSIRVPKGDAIVAAIGNITTRPINAPLKPEMLPLNLIG